MDKTGTVKMRYNNETHYICVYYFSIPICHNTWKDIQEVLTIQMYDYSCFNYSEA